MIDACGGSGEGEHGPKMQPVSFFFLEVGVIYLVTVVPFAALGYGRPLCSPLTHKEGGVLWRNPTNWWVSFNGT